MLGRLIIWAFGLSMIGVLIYAIISEIGATR
jgi:hypothetical protein